MIKEIIKEGMIVPMEVTVQLLENAMTEDMGGNKDGNAKGRFLIDGPCFPLPPHHSRTNEILRHIGFPRKMDQALRFETSVCPSLFTLFFDCPESVMQERLLNRGKTSGRADDNEESIKKRFKVFVETSLSVVEYFEKEGKVERVSATRSPEEVYEEVKGRMEKRGLHPVKK